jgi:hypothetical protein
VGKGDALIRIFLTKATKGDSRAIKALLELTEKIGRIQSAELKLGGRGNYEFMLIPGMAASAEEWQREIAARHETADLRDEVAAARARTGTLPTGSQIDALRESIARAGHFLKILSKTSPGLTPAEIQQRLLAHLPADLFPGGAKAGWWTKAVQLRLQRSVVTRQHRPIRRYPPAG